MENKKCAKPKCNRAPLVKIEVEGSWTFEKYMCTNCNHIYTVHTTVGKVSQVASIGVGVAIVANILNNFLGDGDAGDIDDYNT